MTATHTKATLYQEHYGENGSLVWERKPAMVAPREIFKAAFLCSCTSIFVIPNPPSGDLEPLIEDQNHRRFSQWDGLLAIDLLDSGIIGNGSYCSFEEKGLMDAYEAKKLL